ncbi:hypothetical protein AB1Y20_009890 [Prymnesium parvum]|uniref:FACT complex subunit n=1 Tax=Prymnesium parvum TaxID=97485 RepID=A0AB34K595_PRYPA
MAVTIDPVVFWERLSKLHKTWNTARETEGSVWKGTDALVIEAGESDEDRLYSKSQSLQTWLLGWEFPETILVVGNRAVHVLTSKKKVGHLEPLKTAENATLPLELLARDKTDNSANYASLVQAIRRSHAGAVVGTLLKEEPKGAFVGAFRDALKADGLEQLEIAPALCELLAVKDSTEQACVKRASIFSAVVMQKYLVQRIESVVDEEKKISHEQLAADTEDAFADPLKLNVKLSPELLESCYTPIIQSGGKFNLKPTAASNSDNLYYGAITCSLGARYKSYCSNVGRTYMINPTKHQEKTYKLLLELQAEAIAALKPGAKVSAAMTAVVNRIKSKAPHLEKLLTKNVGFGTGIEFKESFLPLNMKCETLVRPGMVFNVALGFENVEDKEATDKRGRTYAVFLADTVLVTETGAAEVYTDKAPKQWADVSYYLKDGDDDDEPAGGRRGEVEILDSRTRSSGRGASEKQDTSELLAGHQAELEAKMREEALAKVRAGTSNTAGPSVAADTPIAYRDANGYPAALKTNQTHVDGKAEALLVPINGRLVPFHISCIRSITKAEEGAYTHLRINFIVPVSTAASAQQMPKEADKDAHFIKELTFKAKNAVNLNNTFRLVKELRKRVTTREKQTAMEADLVVQEALQLIRTGKIHRLRDVNVRPNVGGKKAPGTLELHVNGLRFQAARGERLDLPFKNIKLAFFQPAEKEILVLMHFHLHNPIMIGKKKTKDVQFYVEIMEASYSLDNAHRSGFDPDELEEEQRERALRNRMNQEFQNFVRKVEEQAKDLEFDIPYRELGFHGVPPHNKSTSFIMPAVNALVELTEPPWFVCPLNDIEVAHFERVVMGLKNFDMVLVLKDFNQKPVQVSAINVQHLDALKTWLDSCNVKFYEGPANLNWGQIMKHINEIGLEGFYDDGGWKFLDMHGDSDDEDEEDPEDAESDFEPSGGSGSEEEESSDEDFSEVDSDEEGSDEASEGSLDSDESEGKDWDEMEQMAKEDDKRRGKYEGEEEGKPKSKKAKSKGEYSDDDEERPKKVAKSGSGGSMFGSKGSSSNAKPGSSKSGSSSKGLGKSSMR